MIELREDGWEIGKRVCVSCESYHRDIVDGLCRGCRGESSYSPARVVAARDWFLARKSARTIAAEREAEVYMQQHKAARLTHERTEDVVKAGGHE